MVAEQGTHSQLLSDPEGVYSTLWRAQSQEATMESILDGRLSDRTHEVREIEPKEQQRR